MKEPRQRNEKHKFSQRNRQSVCVHHKEETARSTANVFEVEDCCLCFRPTTKVQFCPRLYPRECSSRSAQLNQRVWITPVRTWRLRPTCRGWFHPAPAPTPAAACRLKNVIRNKASATAKKPWACSIYACGQPSVKSCGVTCILLTYWSCASLHTSWLNVWLGKAPKEKYRTTAWTTLGSLLERPCVLASTINFRWMFCLKKLKSSVSSTVMFLSMAAILRREHQNHRGHVITPWGEGMLGNYQQNSTKLILSIYSLSNVCNNLI